MNYQQQAVAGMNPVELIVALYDGMVRFLYQAVAAVERRDPADRRTAIGRVLEILMHLQSRLRMDIGGSSAKALAEFYASIFALCLEGSRLESADRLKEAIACIRDVREAWNVAARDPEVLRQLVEKGGGPALPAVIPAKRQHAASEPAHSSWTA
ncbi:MAG TPA: flagellar export chaperone FliS [Acidobacteriaceae bacterium]|jgi:flagellar protein FliS|nr:flagellar export chaperone FliS [Acidobacteriaceae bacterium]